MEKTTRLEHEIAEGLWRLVEDEGEANKGYFEFLACFELPEHMEKQIRDIISEEYKHTCMLLKMAEELTGIKAESYETYDTSKIYT